MSETLTSCPDCAVTVGTLHVEGCDVARCANNGRQRLQCGCEDGCNTIWTGLWPGEAECIEFGWYARFRPKEGGWLQCGPDDEDAGPDLNRLANPVGEAMWDKAAGRYVLRQSAGSMAAAITADQVRTMEGLRMWAESVRSKEAT